MSVDATRSLVALIGLPIALLLTTSCGDDDADNAAAVTSPTTTAPATTQPAPTSPPTTAPSTTQPATSAPTTTTNPPATEAPTTVPPTTDPNAPPPVEGFLDPGTYVGGTFEPPITFTTDSRWSSLPSREGLLLTERLELGEIRATGEIVIDASTDLVYGEALDALINLDGIDFSAPEPVTVGGLTGVVVRTPAIAHEVEVPFMENEDLGTWYAPAGARQEVYVLDRPDDTALIIWADSADAVWDVFYPKVVPLIASIEWQE